MLRRRLIPLVPLLALFASVGAKRPVLDRRGAHANKGR